MWYLLIFIAIIVSEIMINGICIVDEVALCLIAGYLVFKELMLFFGSH